MQRSIIGPLLKIDRVPQLPLARKV
jgi:hypothetical protein